MALLKRKRPGLNDAMSVVTRFVNACNRHDAEGVGSCLHPDFDSIQPMFPSRNFRGADQVRRNWQAIFDAEPGFRLTVLRSAAVDDTVWLELHGAGRDAEVAGVFVMGIQGDRIRWARIYSALVEPVPAGAGEVPGDGHGQAGDDAPIAPVLDIERSGRRRRRSSRRASDAEVAAAEVAEAEVAEGTAAEPEPEVPAEPGPDVPADPEIVPEVEAEAEAEPEVVGVVEVVDVIELARGNVPEPEILVDPPVEPEPEPQPDAVAAEPLVEAEPDAAAEPEPVPEPGEPVVAADPPVVRPKRRFGKKSR